MGGIYEDQTEPIFEIKNEKTCKKGNRGSITPQEAKHVIYKTVSSLMTSPTLAECECKGVPVVVFRLFSPKMGMISYLFSTLSSNKRKA
jgi:hypothetical protein